MSGPNERDEIAAFVAEHHMAFGTNDIRMWSYCQCTPNLELVGAQMPVPDMDDSFWVAGIVAYRAHVADALTDLLAERDRRTAATAIREAADLGPINFAMTHEEPKWRGYNHLVTTQWLRARADRIERGE